MNNFFLKEDLSRNWVKYIHTLLVIVISVAIYFHYQTGNSHKSDDYKDILTIIISIMTTIVTTTFSAVLVALQLASAQFSPRITRAFFRESNYNQGVFYSFLLSITFCCAILITGVYKQPAPESYLPIFYPYLSISAIIFAFILLAYVFPKFIFNIIDSINVASIIAAITKKTLNEIDIIYGKDVWSRKDIETHIRKIHDDSRSQKLLSEKFGYIDFVDFKNISKLLSSNRNLNIYLEPVVGNYVTIGSVLINVEYDSKAEIREISPKLAHKLRECFAISKYRSYDQDIMFGVRQITDIAIKALSDAVNDPTTAVNCIHYLGTIIQRMAYAKIPSIYARYPNHAVHIKEFTFDQLVDLSFDQIYQAGKESYAVVRQILSTITEIIPFVNNPANLKILITQVIDMELSSHSQGFAEFDNSIKKALEKFYKTVPLHIKTLNANSDELNELSSLCEIKSKELNNIQE